MRSLQQAVPWWKSRVSFLLTWVVVFSVCFLRNPSALLEPRLVAEDAIFFSDAFSLSGWESLRAVYGGYWHAVPRLLAEFTLLFPLPLAPFLFSLQACLVSSAMLALIADKSCEPIVPGWWNRTALALLLACLPFYDGVFRLFSMHWYLVFGTTIWLLREREEADLWWLVKAVWCAALIWTAPGALAFAPICCWRLVRPPVRSSRWFYAIILVSQMLWLTLLFTAERSPTAALEVADRITTLAVIFYRELCPIFLLGHPGPLQHAGFEWGWCLAGFMSLAALLLAGLWKKQTRSFTGVLAMVLALSLLLVAYRVDYLMDYRKTGFFPHYRYFFVPLLLFWTLATVVMVDRLRLAREKWWARILLPGLMVSLGMYHHFHYQGYEIPLLPDLREDLREIARTGTHPQLAPGRTILCLRAYPQNFAVVMRFPGEDQASRLWPESYEEFFGPSAVVKNGYVWVPWMGLLRQEKGMYLHHPQQGILLCMQYAKGWYYFVTEDRRILSTNPVLYPQFLVHN